MNPLVRPWLHLFDFKGRATRSEYLLFHVTGVLAAMATLLVSGIMLGVISALLGDPNPARGPGPIILTILIYGLFVITHIAIGVRRLHDHGEPGIKYLLNAIPLIGFFFWLVMVFKRGDDFENDYGPDPRQPDGQRTGDLGGVFS